MWLSRISVHRPVLVTMVVTILMVLGLLALNRLPVDLFPQVSIPVVTVITPYPGAGPDQVEEDVIRPAEDALVGLPGLKDIFSQARENVGIVTPVFEMGTDIQQAAAEIRDRVQAVHASAPEGVEDPIYRRVDPNASPVMTFAVSSEEDPLKARQVVETLVRPIVERVEGVGAVEIRGGEQREIQVELDLPKMAELRIPLLQVVQQVGYDTRDIPSGEVGLGNSTVALRSKGSVRSLDDLGSIVVQGFPSPIYLKDVARLVDGRVEQSTMARVDGRRAVTFDVIKESGANTVAVCEKVRGAVVGMKLPKGILVEPVIDTSDMVRDMAHEMRRALFFGAAMAILVVFLFMVDWRSTLISAVALPTSIVSAFFFMWLAGFSLNLLSLAAMSMAIGILIDDAVVVREVIYRHLEAGENPIEAALKGTSEVALAVLATTLSILAVFIPVGFVGGMVGQFFAQFGLTVAIAVAVSLLIAFTVDPMLSARISKVIRPSERGPVSRALLGFQSTLDTAYDRLLAWALFHPGSILLVAGVLFLGSLTMLALTGSEFMPRYDRSQFQVGVDLPSSTSLPGAEKQAVQFEGVLRDIPEVQHIYTLIGPDGNTSQMVMRVLTSGKGDRDRSIYDIEDEARVRLASLPGATFSVSDPSMLEGLSVGNAIQMEIRGDDLAALREAADRVRLELRKIPGTSDITSTYRPGRPELQLVIDRDKAGEAGISVGQAGMALRMAVAGQVAGKFHDGNQSYDIRMRAREEDRTPDTLLSSVLLLSPVPRATDRHQRGTPVSLGDLGRVTWETAPATIARHDRMRYLRVSCNVQRRALSELKDDVVRVCNALPWPEGTSYRLLGDVELAKDALGSLLTALGLAVIFVYAILASQFESFVHPFTIMLSLPLAIVGALATVFLAGWPIGIPTMLGIILLMGLVTKNGILLVDRANQFRREGASVKEAMLKAGHLRLRPILMTSFAIILGMLPSALSNGAGSEIHRPIALPVIGGVFASTMLTLLVVPVVYLLMEGFRERLRARRKNASASRSPVPLAAEPERTEP
jgi:hydrophobic/amphiphilic exporter-1 (mainly G- bacteria), HAE1 family